MSGEPESTLTAAFNSRIMIKACARNLGHHPAAICDALVDVDLFHRVPGRLLSKQLHQTVKEEELEVAIPT
jgi:hypothetical protein